MKTARRCVLLFARAPRDEGRAKGLAPAEPLFARVLDRIAQDATSLPDVDLVIIGEGGSATGRSPGVFPGARTVAQRGSSFGERFENAFADVSRLGYDEIVAIGGDIPALDGRRISEAFDALASSEVVLGPSPDGGVYLIGVRGPIGALLSDVRWKTCAVFGRLMFNAPSARVLAPLDDLDRRADLIRLAADPALDPDLAWIVRGVLGPVKVVAGSSMPAHSPFLFCSAIPARAPPAAPRSF